VVAFVDGAGFVTSYVAERGALTQLVPTAQLADAVARNESRTFAALVVGPTLGGLLFGIARTLPFLADAVSYVASTASALLIRSDLRPPPRSEVEGKVHDGLLWIWRHPFFRTLSFLSAAGNPIFTGLALLVVLIAHEHHASSLLIGVMLAIAAAGGLVGALIAPRLRRLLSFRTAILAEEIVLVLSLSLLLVVHAAVFLGLVAACTELLTPTVNAMVVSRRVAEAPAALQGRVQAASTLIAFSAGWLGPILVGFLVQQAGSTAAILVLVGWALALTAAVVLAPAVRHSTRSAQAQGG
jgi:predicted MFS family arabinose efflux permease